MPFLQKFADVHLLVGYFFSIVLPIVGFVAACILVRYKGDYTHCVAENHYVVKYPEYLPVMKPIYEAYNKSQTLNVQGTSNNAGSTGAM